MASTVKCLRPNKGIDLYEYFEHSIGLTAYQLIPVLLAP